MVGLRFAHDCPSRLRYAAFDVRQRPFSPVWAPLVWRRPNVEDGPRRTITGGSTVVADELPRQMVEDRSQLMEDVANEGEHPDWWGNDSPADEQAVLRVGIQMSPEMVRVRCVIGPELFLDRVEVLICPKEPIFNGDKAFMHGLTLEGHGRGTEGTGTNAVHAQGPRNPDPDQGAGLP